MLNLHGNPRDYAWGEGGLDAIITQVRLVRVTPDLMWFNRYRLLIGLTKSVHIATVVGNTVFKI